jgi:hypothetical protein
MGQAPTLAAAGAHASRSGRLATFFFSGEFLVALGIAAEGIGKARLGDEREPTPPLPK